MYDVGRFEYWSGFRLCTGSSCAVTQDADGTPQPAGTPLDDLGYYAEAGEEDTPSPTETFAYGAGPAGLGVPGSIAFWAEVRNGAGTAEDLQLDRAPDVGSAPAPMLPPASPTVITATAGPSGSWCGGAAQVDT